MTVVEHLYELRYRLGWMVLAALIGAILGCVWFKWTIAPLPTLGRLVLYPYCTLPQNNVFGATGPTPGGAVGLPGAVSSSSPFGCRLLQTQPFEGFKILLKVGITTGVVLSSPAWLYQVWAFITPGLHPKERRLGAAFVVAGSVLFLIGALIAYLVLPEALRVLTGVAGADFVTAFTASEYVGFMINLLVIFGVSFEIPLLVVMLNQVGILKYAKLKGWRRGIIFALFVFAAFATPGSDPVSMVALAGALAVLFEGAMQIARVHDKRLAKRRVAEGWDTSDPDTATPLNYEPEPILPAPTPTASEPVTPSEDDYGPRNRWDDAT